MYGTDADIETRTLKFQYSCIDYEVFEIVRFPFLRPATALDQDRYALLTTHCHCSKIFHSHALETPLLGTCESSRWSLEGRLFSCTVTWTWIWITTSTWVDWKSTPPWISLLALISILPMNTQRWNLPAHYSLTKLSESGLPFCLKSLVYPFKILRVFLGLL